jgi:hypothetical protein
MNSYRYDHSSTYGTGALLSSSRYLIGTPLCPRPAEQIHIQTADKLLRFGRSRKSLYQCRLVLPPRESRLREKEGGRGRKHASATEFRAEGDGGLPTKRRREQGCAKLTGCHTACRILKSDVSQLGIRFQSGGSVADPLREVRNGKRGVNTGKGGGNLE